jgi:hypothetical protein
MTTLGAVYIYIYIYIGTKGEQVIISVTLKCGALHTKALERAGRGFKQISEGHDNRPRVEQNSIKDGPFDVSLRDPR